MKKYYYLFIFTVILSIASFIPLIIYSLNHLPNSQVPEEAALGKTIWQEKGCIECHTILGNGGYRGPDLTHVYSGKGVTWLENFLSSPPILKPAKRKIHPALDDTEKGQMIAYLKFTDSLKAPNWPPKPVIKR